MGSKLELLEDILASISPQEWKALENEPQVLPVSEFNRTTLLRLRELDPPSGEIADDRVAILRAQLETYLAVQLSSNHDAHRFIIASCIGLTFVLHEPMHPLEPTGIRFRVQDGMATYFCPLWESGSDSLCELCVCHPIDEWEEFSRRVIEVCEAQHGGVAGVVADAALDAGLLETGVIPTSELVFHESVRRVCEGNSCTHYNLTWACPPAVGDLDSCRAKCLEYERMQLVSCAYLLNDEFDFENVPRFIADFDRRIDVMAARIKDTVPDAFVLSNEGCTRCAKCAWPEAPLPIPRQDAPCHRRVWSHGWRTCDKSGHQLQQRPKNRHVHRRRSVLMSVRTFVVDDGVIVSGSPP